MASGDSQIEMATGEYDMITDIDISQIPPEVQKAVDISKNCKVAESIGILVTGKTGSGKSTLVSGLLGINVNTKKQPQVSEYKEQKEGITVIVWDSPGLQDGTGNQAEYLRQMEQLCSRRDLTVYCIRISETRFVRTADNPDVVAMKKLTQKFGQYFWKNCIIALTFANTLQVFDQDWDHLSPKQQEERFKDKIDQWKEQVEVILIHDINVRQDIAKSIKIIPTGHPRKPHLPGCKYWLSNFWFQCVSEISTPGGRLAMVKINMGRIKMEKDVNEDDFKQQPQNQPIVATQSNIKLLPVVGTALAGGAIGGTVLGLMSLIAGPAALPVSIPVGIVIGALVGGGAVAGLSYWKRQN